MNKKFNLFYLRIVLTDYPLCIFLLGLIGLTLFGIALYLYGADINQISLLIISLSLISISLMQATIYFYRKSDRNSRLIARNSELLREKKKGDILLDVGQLCSWQYSMKAGILKFDMCSNRILGQTRCYYTYEELVRNKSISRIISYIVETGATVFDEEAYFPYIKKWVIIRGRCIDSTLSDNPNQFVGILLDNTDRKETMKRIEDISVTDELTGLKNRRFFFESFSRELNLCQRNSNIFSLAMIDLDYFKNINDRYGHLAGDRILKEFAQLLQKEVRPYDIVARFGGEEFIILFPEIKKIEAERIIQRLRQRVKKFDIEFNNDIINFTFSCGVGDVTEMGLYTEKEFITIIDDRLYEAKHKGRNLVISGG